MNLEFIDTIKASDSFMTEEGDQSAKSMAYAHLSKTEIIKHVLKPGTRGFAKYTIFDKDGNAKEDGTPNLVLLQGREFLAQKLSGVPQSSDVDQRDYEIRYFGFSKAYALGYPFWIAIIMGSITGAAGGVLRDIFINEIPLIFRKEIYAMACVIGGLVYWICLMLDMESVLAQIIGGITVFVARILAVKYKITLPILKGDPEP
jgi:hypothetical protein